MPTKTTPDEWNKYLKDDSAWEGGQYFDDLEIIVNGVEIEDYYPEDFSRDSTIVITGGIIIDGDGNEVSTVEQHFKKWRKRQPTDFLVVEINKGIVRLVKSAIIAAGGKIR